MKGKFRSDARKLVASAKKDLNIDGDARIRSAALSLRMAMEAVTYERAEIYKDDLPPKEYKVWQPRKLMQNLLEIDPYADQSRTIAYGKEPSRGQTPDEMITLGTDEVLGLATIKKHYDALGAYLHMPTLDQLETGKVPGIEKLRQRCEEITEALDKVLSSPVISSDFKHTASMECSGCGALIKRRFPPGEKPRIVSCFECGAQYEVSEDTGNSVRWAPIESKVTCPNKACGIEFYVWTADIQVGQWSTCPECKDRYFFGIAIVHRPETGEDENANSGT